MPLAYDQHVCKVEIVHVAIVGSRRWLLAWRWEVLLNSPSPVIISANRNPLDRHILPHFLPVVPDAYSEVIRVATTNRLPHLTVVTNYQDVDLHLAVFPQVGISPPKANGVLTLLLSSSTNKPLGPAVVSCCSMLSLKTRLQLATLRQTCGLRAYN